MRQLLLREEAIEIANGGRNKGQTLRGCRWITKASISSRERLSEADPVSGKEDTVFRVSTTEKTTKARGVNPISQRNNQHAEKRLRGLCVVGLADDRTETAKNMNYGRWEGRGEVQKQFARCQVNSISVERKLSTKNIGEESK